MQTLYGALCRIPPTVASVMPTTVPSIHPMKGFHKTPKGLADSARNFCADGEKKRAVGGQRGILAWGMPESTGHAKGGYKLP